MATVTINHGLAAKVGALLDTRITRPNKKSIEITAQHQRNIVKYQRNVDKCQSTMKKIMTAVNGMHK